MRTATRRLLLFGGAKGDPDALLWRAAVMAAGGTVSPGRLALVSTLIGALKAAGKWTFLDRLWLMAAENSQSALIDLVARSTATAVNSPTFTVDRGYAGNATTSYVNFGYNPSTDKVALSQNSAHLAYYTNSGAQSVAGAGAGSTTMVLHGPFSDGKMYPRINESGATAGIGAALGAGLFIGDRPDAATEVGSRNGADVGTISQASTALVNLPIWGCGGWNGTGVLGNANANRQAMLSVGGSLGSSGRSALYSAVLAYMTSVGAQ